MTGMWMFLLANNYGEIGYGMQLLSLIISVFLFLLFWASSDELPLFALIVLVITISFWHGIYVVSPSQIPDYGTESQKSKMAYCVKQYMQTEHVGLETITNENLETIMQQCQERDEKNAPIQEEQFKNKQLQDGICKVINENK